MTLVPEIQFHIPPHFVSLLWILIVTMTIDILCGYTNAVIKGVASSNRLREGIVRRSYVLALIGVLTALFSLLKDASIHVLGNELHVVHLLMVGSILAEIKSIAEKARELGLDKHPVVRFVLSIKMPGKEESAYGNARGKRREP